MNFNFSGVDTVSLAEQLGTPLYVMSEDIIINNIREVKNAFDNKYDNAFTYYASKAFLTKDMIRIAMKENIGIDVVSEGELFAVISLNFPSKKIMFHGNGKTYNEIEMGIDYNVGKFVCDSLDEIKLINKIAEEKNKIQDILIRITPGIESNTHSHIATASEDSKFGIPLLKIIDAVKNCMDMKNINLTGFHFHVGSQLLDNKSHLMATEITLSIIKELYEKLNFITYDFDFGGGFGVYYKDDTVPPIEYFTEPMVKSVYGYCKKYNLHIPNLYIEPGRRIVGEAGITLYKIGSIKEIPNIRTYASIDGGITDNIRPALYGVKYEAIICNKFGEEKTDVVSIAGKCCEEGDILITDLEVPKLEYGDILAVKSTGAYNYSMASNYNKLPVPAVVMIKDGQSRVSVKRQTLSDLYSRDL